jgi:acyl-CoA synthetase (AMP-forming)/AMP-acid ligase II
LAETTPCAPGEIGEIIATGPSVTRAYHRLPEATAAARRVAIGRELSRH